MGTGDPPHRLGERQSCFRSRLRLMESLEEAGELSGIDLDPAAAQQSQPRRTRQELFDLAGGQRLAIQHQLHVEVEQRVGSQLGRRLTTDTRSDLRPRRPASAPRTGYPHHYPCRLELRNIGQELQGFGRPPAQRVVYLPGIEQLT